MFEEMNMIREEILKFNNKKVKDETLDEYLSSLKNEELTRFAITNVFVNMDFADLFKIKNLNNRSKKYIIDYIKSNFENILEVYIKIINEDEIEQLKVVMDNINKKVNINDILVSLHLINYLKEFSLAKVEYSSKDETIKIFMPKEYIDIFNKALKNKKLLEKNKYYNKVFNYSKTIINVYGIVTLAKLHELFCKQMFNIKEEELYHVISVMDMYEENHTYNYDEDVLLCGMDFYDEDFAVYFYEEQKMDYKEYSKDDYYKLSDNTYTRKLKSYKNLKDYLIKNFSGVKEDMEYIDEFIIFDYINTAQILVSKADKNFKSKVFETFDVDEKEANYLLKLMKNVFNEYPKWSKRGNV